MKSKINYLEVLIQKSNKDLNISDDSIKDTYLNKINNIIYDEYIISLIDKFNNITDTEDSKTIQKISEGLDEDQKKKLNELNKTIVETQVSLIINIIKLYYILS